MALTAEQKTEIINIVNGADFMQPPEVVEGDTLWYPGDIDMIKAGTSLKLKYNSSNQWEENSEQIHGFE